MFLYFLFLQMPPQRSSYSDARCILLYNIGLHISTEINTEIN